MGGPKEPGGPGTSQPSFDGLLVSWAPGSTALERANARAALGLNLREEIHTAAMKSAGAGIIEWVDLPPGLSADQAIRKLSQRPGVAYAEPNWVLQSQAASNDPYVTNGSLWGMYGSDSSPSNSHGTGAAEAWAAGYTGASDVYVGIIDEGYQYTHNDLRDNAGVNPGEISGDRIDNDANGYVDDVYGWDFAGNNNTVYDGTGDDHGTHVAGTIGAKGNNGIGVAGVNWSIKLLSAKFLGNTGGTTANAIKAVDYFTNLKNSGVNIVATNNSWGGGGYSQGLYDAILRANAADILFIAAAGNDSANNDSTASYPSNYNSPNVIAVASITSSGARSSFSNYGATTVDLGAPGSSIESTLPDNTYGNYSGTSMATPHVTGAAALLKSIVPSATGAQIKQALLDSATATASLNGFTVTGGRLDIPAAINFLQQLTGGSSSTPLPIIAVRAIDTAASESGADPGSFQLLRDGDLNAALTVNVLWQGMATNGTDYSSQATALSFAVGSAIADINLTPIDDTLYEGSESVTLKVTSGSGYTVNPLANIASLNIGDNDPLPANTDRWGTANSDNITGDAANNLIAGVSQTGNDNGRSSVDILTGLIGQDRFILADNRRGTFYNDGNSRNNGFGDYALITDLKTAEGDRIQLRAGAQYLIRNNGADTELYLGDGNQRFTSADEYIGLIQGNNFASSTGYFILAADAPWATLV